MSKNSGHRYDDCQAMAEDLRRWLDDEPILARRMSPPERAIRWAKRNRLLAGMGITVLASLALATAVSTTSSVRLAAEKEKLVEQQEKLLRQQKATAHERAIRQLQTVVQFRNSNPRLARTILDDAELFPADEQTFVWRLYRRSVDTSQAMHIPVRLSNHGGLPACFSADGQHLLVGGTNRMSHPGIYRIDLDSGGKPREDDITNVWRSRFDGFVITQLSTSADGRRLGCMLLDQSLQVRALIVFDTETWSPIYAYPISVDDFIAQSGMSTPLTTPNGAYRSIIHETPPAEHIFDGVLTSSGTHVIVKSGKQLAIRSIPSDDVVFSAGIEFDAITPTYDGRHVIGIKDSARQGSRSIHLWDTAEGATTLRRKTPLMTSKNGGMLAQIACAPNSNRFVVWCQTTENSRWKNASGAVSVHDADREDWSLDLEGPFAMIESARFTKDGLLAICERYVGGNPEMIRLSLWECVSGTLIKRVDFEGNSESATTVSPLGRQLALLHEGELSVTRMPEKLTPKVLTGHDSPVTGAAFSPDDRLLATCGHGGRVLLWDTTTWSVQQEIEDAPETPHSVRFTPDGLMLAAATGGGSSTIFRDVATGGRITEVPADRSAWGLQFSRDGRYMATGSSKGTVRLSSVPAAQLESFETELLIDLDANATELSFSPDSTRLAVAFSNNETHIWNLTRNNALELSLSPDVGGYTAVFSESGQMLVVGDTNGTLRLVSVPSGEVIRSIEAHTNNVDCVALSPDGSLIASASADGTVALWDVQTGSRVFYSDDHANSVNGAVCSHDGSILVTWAEDSRRNLMVWDVRDLPDERDPAASSGD